MGSEGAMAVKRAVEAGGVRCMLRVGKIEYNKVADKILEGVVEWELKSKPEDMKILYYY